MNPENHLQPWKILHSQDVFVAAPWMRLSRQQVLLPNDQIVDDYYQLEMPEYAVVVAQTIEEQVILERQYKHGLRQVSLLLPGGAINPGEDPLPAAQRELLEETGYVADCWNSLGSFVVSANYGCGKVHFFAARNAHWIAEPNSGDLEEMEIVLMSLEKLLEAVHQGNVISLGAIAAIALAFNPHFQASI